MREFRYYIIYSEHVETKEISSKLLKIIKHTFRKTSYRKTIRLRFITCINYFDGIENGGGGWLGPFKVILVRLLICIFRQSFKSDQTVRLKYVGITLKGSKLDSAHEAVVGTFVLNLFSVCTMFRRNLLPHSNNSQPRSQVLSPPPPLFIRRKILVAAAHVTTQITQ